MVEPQMNMNLAEILLCLVVLVGFVVLAGAGIFLIVRGTIRKDGFGINTGRPDCPKCGEPVSLAPHPKSLRQACGAAGLAKNAAARWTSGAALTTINRCPQNGPRSK